MKEFSTNARATEYRDLRPLYNAATDTGCVVQVANLFFAIVITVALIVNHTSAIVAIIVGGLYYGIVTYGDSLIRTGTLTEIVRIRTEQRTQQKLQELQYTVYRPPADSLPEPEPEAPKPLPAPVRTANFVSPYEATQSDWTEARLWLAQLFDLRTGVRDPKKVLGDDSADPGRICCKMPSRDAAKLLRQMQILRPTRGNGDKLNPRYPTRKEALAAFDSAFVLPAYGGEGQGGGGGV